MAVGNFRDITQEYKQSGALNGGIYNIYMIVSGWDTVNFQLVAPVAAPISVYATINDGMSQGSLYQNGNYGADKALNWSPVLATNLATGTAATSMPSAGLYSVPVNAPYMRLGAPGANVYGLFQFNNKVQ